MVGAWAEAAAGGMRGDRRLSRGRRRDRPMDRRRACRRSHLFRDCRRVVCELEKLERCGGEYTGSRRRFSQAAASIAIAGAAPGTAAFSASPCVIEAGLARERPKCNKASVASLFNIFNILYVARNSWPRVGGRNGQNFYIDTFARGRG